MQQARARGPNKEKVTFKPNQAQSENEGNFLDFHDVRSLPQDEVSIRRSMSEAAPSSSGSDQDSAGTRHALTSTRTDE